MELFFDVEGLKNSNLVFSVVIVEYLSVVQ